MGAGGGVFTADETPLRTVRRADPAHPIPQKSSISTAHAISGLSKLLHVRFPELTIVVGHWGLHEKVQNDREALLAAGATHVAATLIETRDQIAQSTHPHVKLQPDAIAA